MSAREAKQPTTPATRSIFSAVLGLFVPVILAAQARVIKVVSSDGQPIPYANVIVEGGTTQITDANGEVSLGAGKSQTLTLNVRRIGFTPWFGKIDLPDTAAVLVVKLPQLTQSLSAVTVTGQKDVRSPLVLSGFYDRWGMRQKGLLSAVFISPEELEFRHPDKIIGMLYGLNGVQVARACVVVVAPHRPCTMAPVAFSAARSDCPMAIVVDGLQQFPDDQHPHIDINMLLDASDVSGIEVYARGGNMPIGFQFQDTGCGVLAFWTGSRKP